MKKQHVLTVLLTVYVVALLMVGMIVEGCNNEREQCASCKEDKDCNGSLSCIKFDDGSHRCAPVGVTFCQSPS